MNGLIKWKMIFMSSNMDLYIGWTLAEIKIEGIFKKEKKVN